MNSQRPEYGHTNHAPMLPSFSQLVDTLGQRPQLIPQEPHLSFDTVHTRPPGPLSQFRYSPTKTTEARPSPPGAVVGLAGGDQSPPHSQQNSLLNPSSETALLAYSATQLVPSRKRSFPTTDREGNDAEHVAVPRPPKRRRKDRNQPMNPHYTRDGNLRKRLAQACERCRAQKIKCRLRGPACILCIRQGLDCKFAARGYQTSRKQGSLSSDQPQVSLQLKRSLSRSHSPRLQPSYATTEDRRSSDAASSPPSSRSTREVGICSQTCESQTPGKLPERDFSRITSSIPATDDLSVDIDPYLFDASLTKHYVERYFASINQSPFYMLPKAPFTAWISARQKTSTQKILLYAVLAGGAIFSRHRDQKQHRVLFTRIAQDGLRSCSSWFELPVIHALIILSTASAHAGDLVRARQDSVAAMRCAYGLQLNEETTYSGNHVEAPYLTESQKAECCRRTFWSAYARNTVWGSLFEGSNIRTILHGSLRMPCNDKAYETGEVSEAPLISLHSPDSHYEALNAVAGRKPSHMALMIEATAILRDLVHHESASTAKQHNTTPAATTGAPIHHAIRLWRRRRDESQLNSFCPMPLELQLMDKYLCLLVHRYLTPVYLQARLAATQLLQHLHLHHTPNPEPVTDPLVPSTIFLAFDTLTASNLLTTVLDRRDDPSTSSSGHPTFMALATHAVATMSELAEYSQLAASQLGAMKRRLAAIMAQSNTKEAWVKSGFWFRASLCEAMRRGRDVVYDLEVGLVAEALGLGREGGGEMMEMRVPVEGEGRV